MMLSGHFHLDVLELHKQYGSVVRIAPNELVYSDAVIWRDAYAKRSGHTEFPRSTIMETVNGATDIISANAKDHVRFRELFSRMFSENSVRKQESRIVSHVDRMVHQLSTQSRNNESVDLVQWFSWAVFDFIGDLSFGESFNCLTTGRLHPWLGQAFAA
jgi:cytochrome P450